MIITLSNILLVPISLLFGENTFRNNLNKYLNYSNCLHDNHNTSPSLFPALLLHLVFVLHVFELVLGPGHVDAVQYGLPAAVVGEESGRFRDWLHPGQLGGLHRLPEVARHLGLFHAHQPLLSGEK